jgi:hypothetical protein
MKIAIISDTHDQEIRLKKLIEDFNENIKPELLIHCGDLVSPFMFKELAKFNGDVHIVFGYQDVGSLLNLVRNDKAICKLNNLIIHDEFGELEIGDKKLAFIHNNKLGLLIAESGKYDAVFYGHTHEARIEKIKDCLTINPGDIMGRKNNPSYVILNTEKMEAELIEINN